MNPEDVIRFYKEITPNTLFVDIVSISDKKSFYVHRHTFFLVLAEDQSILYNNLCRRIETVRMIRRVSVEHARLYVKTQQYRKILSISPGDICKPLKTLIIN